VEDAEKNGRFFDLGVFLCALCVLCGEKCKERFLKFTLFRLDRELGFSPLVPSADEGKGLGVSHFHEFLCHPGTGSLALSGAVEDESLIFRILVGPFLNLLGILPDGALDLFLAAIPVALGPDVNEDDIRLSH